MSKITYKVSCRKLIGDVPYPVTFDHMRWLAAMAGAESSVGLIDVQDGTGQLAWRRDGGLVLKVRMERRKPPEAIVEGMYRKRLKAIKTEMAKEETAALYDQVKAEVWNVTPSRIKDVFVKIIKRDVYIYADAGTADKVTAFLRSSFGTFPNDRMWDGKAFSDLFIDHLLHGVDIGMAGAEDCITFCRAKDRSTVSITDAPNLYSDVDIEAILSAADTVSSIGFRSGETGELTVVTSVGTIFGVLEVVAGVPGVDDNFADFMIYSQQAEATAAEICELSDPYRKHEDVEDGTPQV